jgi:hypothetical protein
LRGGPIVAGSRGDEAVAQRGTVGNWVNRHTQSVLSPIEPKPGEKTPAGVFQIGFTNDKRNASVVEIGDGSAGPYDGHDADFDAPPAA